MKIARGISGWAGQIPGAWLNLIVKQGYAVDNEEITRGIMCTAAPVYDFSGELVCAVSITFPAYINEDRGIEPEIETIKRYASLISDSLGRK